MAKSEITVSRDHAEMFMRIINHLLISPDNYGEIIFTIEDSEFMEVFALAGDGNRYSGGVCSIEKARELEAKNIK